VAALRRRRDNWAMSSPATMPPAANDPGISPIAWPTASQAPYDRLSLRCGGRAEAWSYNANLAHALARRHPQLAFALGVWVDAGISTGCALPTLTGMAALLDGPHRPFVNQVRRAPGADYEIVRGACARDRWGGGPGPHGLRAVGRLIHLLGAVTLGEIFRDGDATLQWIVIDDPSRRDRYWRLALPARESHRSADADVLVCVVGFET